MAVSGFEGFEKRLELNFSRDDPAIGIGFRRLHFQSLEKVLHAVQCTVVSALGNQYTRGNFIFPEEQPYPHTSFEEEIVYLEENLPENLCCRKASVMPSKLSSHSWHVFSACDQSQMVMHKSPYDDQLYTMEVCMTGLDRVLARKFFRRPNDGKNGDSAGKEISESTHIRDINPNALICEFAFDPCGYSMNGIDGDRYSTIHVTPEDGFSYASFECVASIYDDIVEVLNKAVQVFRPATVSVATTCTNREVWMQVAEAIEPLGMKFRSCTMDDFSAAGSVVFQVFTSRRK
ncbi:unnamed protein product [Fraxinus pennsylvanica]|uniref:S-adenosylmethionine decarboxylase proenzyme n=1 Tax=Fraxinus pennsylvanica TaxID=56036 RepID=A0AAD1YVZ4_9LAMI|nr:unnamed protein product [Fraxinus pennsylvanica]